MWQCQHNDSKDASTTGAMMQVQHWQRCSIMRATMPAQCWQRHQQNGGKYARTTMATTSMQQWQRPRCNGSIGWQCQLNYGKNASATRAINTSVAPAKMPTQQGWWGQRKKGNDTSAMMVERPAWWWQWRQRNKDNNASAITRRLRWLNFERDSSKMTPKIAPSEKLSPNLTESRHRIALSLFQNSY